jgi:hypothetical protein
VAPRRSKTALDSSPVSVVGSANHAIETAARSDEPAGEGDDVENSTFDAIFAPDIVVPVQFFNNTVTDCPEKRLMLAVLCDAVSTLGRLQDVDSPKARRQVLDIEEWIAGEDGDDWPFSFERVCVALGFDPDYIRRGIRDHPDINLRRHNHRAMNRVTPRYGLRREFNRQRAAIGARRSVSGVDPVAR